MVFVTSHVSGCRKVWVVHSKTSTEAVDIDKPSRKSLCGQNLEDEIAVEDIIETILQREGTCSDISLTHEGKPVSLSHKFRGNDNIVATIKLYGGKGGFGSMLRAIGAQIEKTTNREACRDLSGRRLRDINEEKRLKEYLSKKVEKEKEVLELKRKRLEQMKDGTRHTFEDKGYFEQREKRERDIFDSLDRAYTSNEGPSKQKSDKETSTKYNKRLKKNHPLKDLDDSSEEESSDENSNQESSIGNLYGMKRSKEIENNYELGPKRLKNSEPSSSEQIPEEIGHCNTEIISPTKTDEGDEDVESECFENVRKRMKY